MHGGRGLPKAVGLSFGGGPIWERAGTREGVGLSVGADPPGGGARMGRGLPGGWGYHWGRILPEVEPRWGGAFQEGWG